MTKLFGPGIKMCSFDLYRAAGVPFLITAELFKQSHRPAAYSVAGCLNWLSNFTIGFVFPFLEVRAKFYPLGTIRLFVFE